MESLFAREIQELLEGQAFSFGDWPNMLVRHVAAGLYSIWHGPEFIYIGMSGRGLSEPELQSMRSAGQKRRALFSRLESHASGRRSGAPRANNVETESLHSSQLWWAWKEWECRRS